jgi:exo-1,4-beta-D-glucosaminidase
VLPVLWSDNDITVWPGRSQTIVARYRTTALGGSDPVVTVSGWNVSTTTVAAS